jgi:hypothetical protein
MVHSCGCCACTRRADVSTYSRAQQLPLLLCRPSPGALGQEDLSQPDHMLVNTAAKTVQPQSQHSVRSHAGNTAPHMHTSRPVLGLDLSCTVQNSICSTGRATLSPHRAAVGSVCAGHRACIGTQPTQDSKQTLVCRSRHVDKVSSTKSCCKLKACVDQTSCTCYINMPGRFWWCELLRQHAFIAPYVAAAQSARQKQLHQNPELACRSYTLAYKKHQQPTQQSAGPAQHSTAQHSTRHISLSYSSDSPVSHHHPCASVHQPEQQTALDHSCLSPMLLGAADVLEVSTEWGDIYSVTPKGRSTRVLYMQDTAGAG